MLKQVGTIVFKNKDKILHTKKLFAEQPEDFEINKQEFLEQVKILSEDIIDKLLEELKE